MKKLILLSSIVLFALASMGQTKTVTLKKLSPFIQNETTGVISTDYVTYKYTASSNDKLTFTGDTIFQMPVVLNKEWPSKYYINVVLDTIAGVDTTVVINIKGKMFSDQSYSLIETTTTSVISAEISTVIESMTDPTYSTIFGADSVTTVTPVITPFYRYLMVELDLSGDDSVGTGVAIKSIELFIVKTD